MKKEAPPQQLDSRTSFREISSWISSVQNLDNLLELILESAAQMMNAKASSLLVLDRDTNTLYFKAATGEKKKEIKKFRVKLGQGIAGSVAKSGKPLLISDVRKDKRWYSEISEFIAFEPRSLTAARRDFGDAYLEALSGANLALVAAPFHSGRLADDEILDREGLARELGARGVQTLMPAPDADAVEVLLPHLQPGDVVLGCSSGSFDGFHSRLLEALRESTHE